jgi:hypothetical protein
MDQKNGSILNHQMQTAYEKNTSAFFYFLYNK